MTLQFETERLNVFALSQCEKAGSDQIDILNSVPSILTENVVKDLPEYFHGIRNAAGAKEWLTRMMTESALHCVVDRSSQTLIGFLFLYDAGEGEYHLGYLLSEPTWGKGLATELIKGLLEAGRAQSDLKKILGGVAELNKASIKVLEKTGFNPVSKNHDVIFYEYTF